MRRSREAFIAKLHAECPHHVDLIPPPDGFAYETWEAIYAFLDARIGSLDMYGQAIDGLSFFRFCFLHEEDANQFRTRFARVGTILYFPRSANG